MDAWAIEFMRQACAMGSAIAPGHLPGLHVRGPRYALVNAIGWDKRLGIVGFEVTTVQSAPDSQCNRAREQVGEGDDIAIACVSDREWLKRFRASCSAGKESNLALVDTDGALTSIGTSPEEWRADGRPTDPRRLPRR